MERELFDWTDWDGDQEYMTFYNPVLKVRIGKHAAGTKFDSAVISYAEGKLSFFNTQADGDLVELGFYKVHLVVDDLEEVT